MIAKRLQAERPMESGLVQGLHGAHRADPCKMGDDRDIGGTENAEKSPIVRVKSETSNKQKCGDHHENGEQNAIVKNGVARAGGDRCRAGNCHG